MKPLAHRLGEQGPPAARRESLPPERAVFVSFDDDRLAELAVDQLGLLLEE